MKQVHGYWVPERETRLQELLDESVALGRPAYQHRKLDAALTLPPMRRVAIDVGSHIGMWTMQLLQHGFEHVHAFDPDPQKAECFDANLRAFVPILAGAGETGFENVTSYPVGLGAQRQTVSLVHKSDTTLKTHVKPDPAGTLKIVPLDDFAFRDVDFIKIDVEGFEKFVVEGAEATIRREKPVIVVEQKKQVAAKRYQIGDQDALRLLEGWGYSIFQEFNGDFVMAPPR
ncbi:hypothetical protein CcrC1_gp210c [Caulobacter phage C1]|nr:hypothetical protein CcrC1_gp210c [Caulobacter phage C1]UTU08439.1 hypothetical protein CcrC2_gp211c [Caulobacter phage C2]UTU08956.1 hypothetical protein CcrJ4_gp205c [Caulobacter phage J4]UTU09514.1 hypothetical protein CcrBL47_gp228c [Caulobacter phage BL47]UTU10072.1 hypothetical protein CcrRB23_gp210c [Caulobacter phage RB23]WGN97107.1 hypothetical protein [Bertelyvirus sp.]